MYQNPKIKLNIWFWQRRNSYKTMCNLFFQSSPKLYFMVCIVNSLPRKTIYEYMINVRRGQFFLKSMYFAQIIHFRTNVKHPHRNIEAKLFHWAAKQQTAPCRPWAGGLMADLHHFCLTKKFPKTHSAI